MSIVSSLWLSAALFLLLVWLLQRFLRGRRGLLFSALGAALLFIIPIFGQPARYWVAALAANVSVPLVAVLIASIAARAGFPAYFRAREWRAVWIFGAVSALALYPSALGLGLRKFDSYALGWPWMDSAMSLALFGTAALTSALLVCRGNRFGWVLLLSSVAYLFRIQESQNFWDYLLDPLYAAVSLAACAALVGRRLKGG